MKKLIVIALFFLLSSCGTAQKAPDKTQASASTPKKVEQKADQAKEKNTFGLELETTDGDTFSYEAVKGKKVLFISFWATWCEPCKAELMKLADIAQKHKENLQVIAISIDPEENMDAVQEFAVEMALPYPVLVDPSGNFTSNVIPGGDTVPYSMLIDKTGKIVATHTGYEPGDEKRIEEEIQELLR